MSDSNNTIVYPISLIFYLYGFNINLGYTRNNFIKYVIQFTFKLIINVTIIYFIYRRLFLIKYEYSKFHELLYPISTFLKIFTVLLSLICFQLKLLNIKKLITELTDILSENEKTLMKFMA